ncbi:MAG: HAD family hydrolase [Legionellaceae bacterium]|nr:HAD family hydrolase [Legionellaceae bacterium]
MHEETILSRFLTSFDLIIFDLDGVIIDSNHLKIACMRDALGDFNRDVVESYLQDFSKNFGQPRLFHFKNLYYNTLGRDGDFDAFYQCYASRYAALLDERYCNAALCEHADDAITLLAESDLKLFVATGTNTNEAEKVLKHKQLHHYFEGIYGSPREKVNIISTLLTQQPILKEKVLFIGDAAHDALCAQENQIPFLFVEHYALIELQALRKQVSTPFYSIKSLYLNNETHIN